MAVTPQPVDHATGGGGARGEASHARWKVLCTERRDHQPENSAGVLQKAHEQTLTAKKETFDRGESVSHGVNDRTRQEYAARDAWEPAVGTTTLPLQRGWKEVERKHCVLGWCFSASLKKQRGWVEGRGRERIKEKESGGDTGGVRRCVGVQVWFAVGS